MDFACWLAKQHDASLEGLVVLDMQGIQRSVGAVPLGAMRFAKTSIAAKEKECHQLIEELLGKFTARCEAVGVRHTEFEMQGAPAEAILTESNYFDCVVIGLRTFFTYSSGAGEDEVYGTADDEPGDSLEEIMESAQLAQAHDFIMKMPGGYSSMIEERAVNISGGQPLSHNFRIESAVAGHEISDGDMRRAFQHGIETHQPKNREIIHSAHHISSGTTLR